MIISKFIDCSHWLMKHNHWLFFSILRWGQKSSYLEIFGRRFQFFYSWLLIKEKVFPVLHLEKSRLALVCVKIRTNYWQNFHERIDWTRQQTLKENHTVAKIWIKELLKVNIQIYYSIYIILVLNFQKVIRFRMCARVAYCVDIDKSVIIGNFEKRGWVSVGPGERIDLFLDFTGLKI